MIEVYPWLGAVWQRLSGGVECGRFSHASLLYGPRGIGKRQLARALSALLLCSAPRDGRACGHCRSCQQFVEAIKDEPDSGHPEFFELETVKGIHQVDDIRAIGNTLSLSHHSHFRRVILIHDAECMNRHAANALLRTLEEPPPESYFVLTSSERMRIIATVRSRLNQFLCTAQLNDEQTRDWLAKELPDTSIKSQDWASLKGLCHGAPLLMRDFLVENKLEKVNQFYSILCQKGGSAALVQALAPWAGKEIVSDSLDWMLYLIQSQILTLQDGQGAHGAQHDTLPMPSSWPGSGNQRLLSSLHGIVRGILERKALLAKNQFYTHMLSDLGVEYHHLQSG